MKLKKLLEHFSVQVKGSKEIEITGICAHSKFVAPGNLFIAKKGKAFDAKEFISDAIAAGAVAILSDSYNPFLPAHIVQLVASDVEKAEQECAAAYYQFPDKELFLVGITGTNGKTTSSYLAAHLFEGMDLSCGLIGTVEWKIGTHIYPSHLTTPDLVTNYKLFREMLDAGCKDAVMETSSQALHQGRLRGICFDAALFTNLTLDHLDYHKTMEDYASAKALLFASLEKSKVAIVNADSPWAARMLQECKTRVLTYGIESKADVRASHVVLSFDGISATIEYGMQKAFFSSPLIGRFNLYNCLGVIALGLSRGWPLGKICVLLSAFKKVPGRLERVPNQKGLQIFVDFAHSDDALKNVLETLKEIKTGKLITVFGCGGNRDATKRPKMGRIVEEYADLAIITSDNPRSEDPESIIKDILQGFREPAKALVQSDRARAIQEAVRLARPQDMILIAGKGHETYQIFAQKTIAFSDSAVAAAACKN